MTALHSRGEELQRAPVDLARCFEAHGEWLRSSIQRLTGSRECAEEIVQDTFRYALEHQGELYDGPALRGWLHRVARHQSMHRFRGRSRFRLALERLLHEPIAPAQDPHEAVVRGERAQRVHRCLDEVRPERREVLTLFEMHELSMNEIASQLGIAPGTVGSRLTRGRAELREAWLTCADG